MRISAPNAEASSHAIRARIRLETEKDPVKQFEDALDKPDWMAANNILSASWFGVPESTDCWEIPGFGLTVELLEDPPDDEDDE